MPTARQLANLRPARPAEVRNPEGRNQFSRDRECREQFLAICRVINECEDHALLERLMRALVEQVIDGAIRGDVRLLGQLLDPLLPVQGAGDKVYNQQRRLRAAFREDPIRGAV
jgi:hypothetical protein